MNTTLYIKNMVCDRCIMAVGQVLKDQDLHALSVDLGEVHVEDVLSDGQRDRLRKALEDLGFELLDDKRQQTIYIEQRVERVKELIKYDQLSLTQIANKMNYSSVAYLSSQFKSVTGMTPSAFKAQKKNTLKALDKI
jgi:AraC-like DNA-binding protein